MTMLDVLELVDQAHTAAKSGRLSESRTLIDRIEASGHGGDDVFISLALLHSLTGDPVSARRWMRRVSPDRLFAFMKQAAETEPYAEDVLGNHSFPTYRPQQVDRRDWSPCQNFLARGEFEAAMNASMDLIKNLPYGLRPLRLKSEKRLKLWRGEPVTSLVVIFSAGHGDTFLFGRYLKDLTARIEDVVAIVQAPMVALLEQNADGFRVAQLDKCSDDLELADAHAEMSLLPHQSGAGYGVAKWLSARPREDSARKGLHVGVVWNGNLTADIDALRSIPIEKLQPLFSVPGINWHSLQIGPKATECPGAVLDHSGEIRNFLDTANIIAGLDLVIGSDTSVPNLAGAMGIPVWALVERENEFRWGTAGDRTPWFPSARVFRQSTAGDWGPVIENVRAALGELVKTRCDRRSPMPIPNASAAQARTQQKQTCPDIKPSV